MYMVLMCCTHTVIYYTQRPDHNTGSFVPYIFRIVCGFFNVPCYMTEDTGDETYGLSTFSEKTRMFNHLRNVFKTKASEHILLSYFKTLSVGLVCGLNPAKQSGALSTELTRRR